jgi:hypothetical protein
MAITGLMSRIRSWFKGVRPWLAVWALGVMALVRIALWTLPFPWTRRGMQFLCPLRFALDRYTEQQATRAIADAAHFLPQSTCLTQALTLQLLLQWTGLECRVHIGVCLHSRFESHAWVERDGRILVGGDAESARYTRLLTLGPTA